MKTPISSDVRSAAVSQVGDRPPLALLALAQLIVIGAIALSLF